MRFELATDVDDPELRRLLAENPFAGTVSVSLEREPNAFLAESLLGDVHQTIVAREETTGRLCGTGCRAISDAWINGRSTRLGYLSQLRLDRGHRGKPWMIRDGYALLRELHQDAETPFYVSTIVEDNNPARRLLERGLPGFPRYHPLEPFVTLAIPICGARRRAVRGLEISRAREQDLDAVVDLLARHGRRHQFAPVWSRRDFLTADRTRGLRVEDFMLGWRASRLAGCCALWDQRGFKQTVVHGYGRALALTRPLINAVSPFLRLAPLPRPGQALRSAFLSHLAVDDDDPEIATGLIAAALAGAPGDRLDYLLLGLAARSPVLGTIERAFPSRRYVSILYAVHWEDGASAVKGLDDRVPHLELAVL